MCKIRKKSGTFEDAGGVLYCERQGTLAGAEGVRGRAGNLQGQNLKDETANKKHVKKAMARVGMKENVMKESKVKLSHCPKNLSEAVKKVLNGADEDGEGIFERERF